MKATFVTIILIAIILASCSSGKNESSQIDTTLVETDTLAIAEEADADMTGGSTMYQSQKNDLEAFMAEFNGLKETSNKIVFDASYDLGGFTRTCHFVDGKFRFFHIDEGGEGGFGETTLMRTQSGKESILRTGTETQGFFKLVDNGNVEWFTATMDMEKNIPVLQEASEPIENSAEALLKEIITTIIENKNKFTLVDGRYEWYQRKEKVESEYGGQTDVYEVFRIDPKLFELDLNSLLPKGQ